MRFLITAPATNDRGPRYMERALAAIHTSASSVRSQANHERVAVSLEYGTHEGRVGLFLRIPEAIKGLVTGPVTANYPNCSITEVEPERGTDSAWETWSANLELAPELFPILRHAQFEDMLNGNFADPITSVLRAIKPDKHVQCRIEIVIAPAGVRRCRAAAHAVKRLDREFFHRHPELAHYYARHITRRHGWLLAWILGLIAAGTAVPPRSTLDTSASRLHDREDDLQAASEKIGGHLFETHLRLIVQANAAHHRQAFDRIRQMAGALGSFTKSRLAAFHVGHIRRGAARPPSGQGFLLSHEELATLFHPPTATVAAEGMQMEESTELEPPAFFRSGQEAGAVTLGKVRFRDDRRLVGIDRDDRRRHVYIVGSTGAGITHRFLDASL